MNRKIIGLAMAAGALANGCVGVAATQAVHKKAYVVIGSSFGTSFWNCAATSGTPKCWQVREREVEQ